MLEIQPFFTVPTGQFLLSSNHNDEEERGRILESKSHCCQPHNETFCIKPKSFDFRKKINQYENEKVHLHYLPH